MSDKSDKSGNASQTNAADAAVACAPPPIGVYAPLPSFFKNEWNGDPDHDAMERHCERLLASGITGVILHSPTAESMSLCPGERLGFLTTVSDFLAKHSHTILASPVSSPSPPHPTLTGVDEVLAQGRSGPNTETPSHETSKTETETAVKTGNESENPSPSRSGLALIVDCSAPALWQVVERLEEAKGQSQSQAGWAVVGLRGEYVGEMGEEDVVRFFQQISSWSPLPLVLSCASPYVPLPLTVLSRLLPLGNITAVIHPTPELLKPLRSIHPDLTVFATNLLAEYPLTVERVHGVNRVNGVDRVVSVLGNLLPRLATRGLPSGVARDKWDEAATRATAMEEQGGVVDLKYAMSKYLGYGGTARSPLPEPSEEVEARVCGWLDGVMEMERALEQEQEQE